MALINEESLPFLEDVQRYDCLYNKFSKDYRNKFKKLNCWVKIGEKYGITAEEAEKKYRNIRTAYGRLLRKVRNAPSGSGRGAAEIPSEYKNLEWLNSQITHRKTQSNFNIDLMQNESANDIDESCDEDTEFLDQRENAKKKDDDGGSVPGDDMKGDDYEIDEGLEGDGQNQAETAGVDDEKKSESNNGGQNPVNEGRETARSREKRPWAKKKLSKRDVDLTLIEAAKSVTEANKRLREQFGQKPQDHVDEEDALFCRSLIPRMHRLSPQAKAFVRCQIEQLFYQAEYRMQFPMANESHYRNYQPSYQFQDMLQPQSAFPTGNISYRSFLDSSSSSSTPLAEST